MANFAAIWPGTYIHRGIYYKNPPFENGAEDSVNSPYFNVKAKTGITIGAITYIANCQVQEEPSGVTRTLSDTVIKSDPLKYYTFRQLRRFTPHQDGAEIVRLMTFADRLLIFTSNALYVMNIAGDNEYMEHQFIGKGISTQSSACVTDYGVAFVNGSGAYVYNGNTIIDLFDKKESSVMLLAGGNIRTGELSTRSTATGGDASGLQKNMDSWFDFVVDGKVAYSPTEKKLFIFRGKSEKSSTAGTYDLMGDAYCLHFLTQCWTYIEDFTEVESAVGTTTDVYGAFQVDTNNDMIAITRNQSSQYVKLIKYEPTPTNATIPKFRLWTRNFDFQAPNQLKKLYKISVYSIGSNGLSLYYSIDGGSTKVFVGNLDNSDAVNPTWKHFTITGVSGFNYMFGIYEEAGQTPNVAAQVLELNCVYRKLKQKSL